MTNGNVQHWVNETLVALGQDALQRLRYTENKQGALQVAIRVRDLQIFRVPGIGR